MVGYALALLQAYPGRTIHTVILCGPGVRKAPPPIDLGLLPYTLSYVLIGTQDGDATLRRLQALTTAQAVWSEEDRLDLYLLLLMRHRQDTETVARRGLALAEGLPSSDRPRVIGAILSLAYHYQGQALLDRLVEGLMATQVWERQLVESLERGIEQGIERGIEQGIERGIEQGIERGIEQGIERGIEQGIEQGRTEERRALLRHAVVRRFGAVPPSLEARIGAADAETLAGLFDQVLVATTIDDI